MINRKTKAAIVLYPNPASNFIQLKNITTTDMKEVQLLSADGKLLLSATANASMQYDISKLKNGMYFAIVIRKDGTSEIKQFAKQ